MKPITKTNHDVLGQRGEDLVSGLKGTITGILEDSSGSIQYLIEPKKSVLNSDVGFAIDYQQIVVTDRKKKRLPYLVSQPQFAIGERVAGTIIEVEGTVVARVSYLNGCIRCTIQPFDTFKADDQVRIFEANIESIQDDERFTEKRDNRVDWNALGSPLSLNGETVVEEPVVDTDTVKATTGRTGGPSQRIDSL